MIFQKLLMNLWWKEILGVVDINLAILIVSIFGLIISIIALFISWRSRELAQNAFSLSLFNNRYKFYHEFRVLIEEISVNYSVEKVLEVLDKLKFLLWESKYIFGDDISKVLETLDNDLNIWSKQNTKNTEKGLELGNALKEQENNNGFHE